MNSCWLQGMRVPGKKVLAENGFKEIGELFRLALARRVLPDGIRDDLFLVFFQAGLFVVFVTGKQNKFPILPLFYDIVHLALVNEFPGMFPGQQVF